MLIVEGVRGFLQKMGSRPRGRNRIFMGGAGRGAGDHQGTGLAKACSMVCASSA